jgi:hypothetical protein
MPVGIPFYDGLSRQSPSLKLELIYKSAPQEPGDEPFRAISLSPRRKFSTSITSRQCYYNSLPRGCVCRSSGVATTSLFCVDS